MVARLRVSPTIFNYRELGSLARRALRRKETVGRAIGPSRPDTSHMNLAPLTPAQRIEVQRAWNAVINDELATIEFHIDRLNQRIARAVAGTALAVELVAERRQCRDLMKDIESDRHAQPTRNRYGQHLTDRDRQHCANRARRMMDHLWAEAERAEAAGDYHQARRWRIDSLRARQIVEREELWRNPIPTYM